MVEGESEKRKEGSLTNRGRDFKMSTFKNLLLAGAVALTPAHAYAAPKEAPIAEAVTVAMPAESESEPDSEQSLANAKAKMQKEIDQAIALIEKIFEVDKLPPVDPAQLALAQQTTNALIPAGSIEKMLDNMYGKLFRAFMDQTSSMSDLMLSIKTGVDSEKIAALDATSKTAIADMFDPHRKEREDQINKVIKPLISEALGDLEPPMRDGLARAYARKFSAQQLGDLNAFLATPTGQAYGAEWMSLQADPEVMIAMVKAVPPLINKFIDRGPELEGQLKDLPKEKAMSDLTDAELAKLAKLMKVDVKTLKENRDMWNDDMTTDATAVDAVDAAGDAADAAADAADAAAATADAAGDYDEAYDRSNWSAADLQKVEDLEAEADKASSAAYDAEQEAVANARKRLKPST